MHSEFYLLYVMATAKENKEIKQPIKLRFRTLADGRQSIFLDYSKNGKHSYEFLKLYLLPETTKAIERKNKAVLKEAKAILKERIAAFIEKKGKEQTCVSSKMLLSEWLDQYIVLMKARGSRSIRAISTMKARLMQFDSTARLCDVNKDFFLRLISYLRNDYRTSQGKPIKQKTAWNTVVLFSVSISAAVNEDLLPSNPYYKVSFVERIKRPEGVREYLTIDEVKKLIDTPMRKPGKREGVKQAFLFSCFCGLRISDVKALKWSNITEELGQKYVSVVMRKTETPIHIPLSKQAVKWMPEQTSDDADTLIFDSLKCPLMVTQYINEWVADAGITKHVTFHTSRHTCATMLLTLGADIYTVSKILGHSRLKETQIYAKIVNSKKDAAVNLADAAFG